MARRLSLDVNEASSRICVAKRPILPDTFVRECNWQPDCAGSPGKTCHVAPSPQEYATHIRCEKLRHFALSGARRGCLKFGNHLPGFVQPSSPPSAAVPMSSEYCSAAKVFTSRTRSIRLPASSSAARSFSTSVGRSKCRTSVCLICARHPVRRPGRRWKAR